MTIDRRNLTYKITSPSGKYYLGSTNNIERRFREHCGIINSKNHGSTYIRYAAQKYGHENLVLEILEVFNTREDAYIGEQKLLDENLKDVLCMNIYETAKGYNSETAKQARANVKNVFDINQHMQNNPHLRQEHGIKLKQFYKDNPQAGIKSSQLQRGFKYIEVFNPEGISIGKFEDIKSLKIALPQFVSSGNISSCASGKLKHYKKHTFVYTD